MIEDDTVVREVVVRATPDDVFPYFVEAEKLARWIGISASLDARPGGLFRFEVVPGEFCEGAYVEVDAPHRVTFTWGWSNPAMGTPPASSTVEVTLRAVDGGTVVRLVHRGLGGGLAPKMHDEGWERFLTRLAGEIDDGDPGAYPEGVPEALR